MKKSITMIMLFCLSLCLLMCKKNESGEVKETILEGKTSILVDETLQPIIEDQIAVFESDYKAKITLIAKSEAEAVQAFVKDSSQILVMARDLNDMELKLFEKRKINPKRTQFATDGIALIANKATADTLIVLQDIINFMQGKATPNIKGLVFDNPNSSTVRYINELAGTKSIPAQGVFSFKTNEEVVKFVAENKGMIGVVGLNWVYQPTAHMQPIVDKVRLLSVRGLKADGYFYPSQSNLADGTYPLARDLFIINAQGYSGLGMGFGSFITGERGQRIILKSGLLPIRLPGRSINIRTKIEK